MDAGGRADALRRARSATRRDALSSIDFFSPSSAVASPLSGSEKRRGRCKSLREFYEPPHDGIERRFLALNYSDGRSILRIRDAPRCRFVRTRGTFENAWKYSV